MTVLIGWQILKLFFVCFLPVRVFLLNIMLRACGRLSQLNHWLFLDFGPGHGFTACEFEPHVGLCSDGGEPACNSLSPSFSAAPSLQINKLKKIKNNKIKSPQTDILLFSFSISVREISWDISIFSLLRIAFIMCNWESLKLPWLCIYKVAMGKKKKKQTPERKNTE